MHRRRLAITCMLAAALVLAAAPAAIADAPSKAPPGYRTVKVKAAGFGMVVPEEWKAINLTRGDAESLFEQLEEDAPDFAEQLSNLVAQNGVLFAIDLEASGDLASTVNVLQVEGATEDLTIEDLRPEFERITPDAEFSEVEIGGRSAVRIDYTLDLGGALVHGVQFVVVGKYGGLVFTFSAGPEGFSGDVDLMASSIKLK